MITRDTTSRDAMPYEAKVSYAFGRMENAQDTSVFSFASLLHFVWVCDWPAEFFYECEDSSA